MLFNTVCSIVPDTARDMAPSTPVASIVVCSVHDCSRAKVINKS